MKEEILARLQELRKDDFSVMEFAAERSVEMMKAYCNLTELPEEVLGIGVSLAGMILDSGMAAVPSTKAKSIKEGDISVTFAEGMGGKNETEMLGWLKEELNRYRRVNW